MSRIIVNIHSNDGIKTEIEGHNQGRLTVERTPPTGPTSGMGYGGGEILCFAAATCLYNNIQRLARDRAITLHTIEIEVIGVWEDMNPSAQEISLRPTVTAEINPDELKALICDAFGDSSVANTLSHGVPVMLKLA